MNIKNNKTGAVELSLNLIIMLVIGLTVLGLVIPFVTGFLGSAEDSFADKITEDDKTKIDQVIREDGNFAFLTSTLNIQKGEEAKLYIKVRNPTGASDSVFSGGQIKSTTDGLTVSVISAGGDGTALANDPIIVQGPPITLDAGEEEGYALIVSVDDSLATGNYFATFEISIGATTPETYSETVTIEVE